MSLKANYTKLKCDYLKKMQNAQLVVNASIKLSDNEEGIKLLTATAFSKVNAIESMNDSVKVSGSISWKALYAVEGNELKSIDYISDFSDTIEIHGVAPTMKLIAKSTVLDIDYELLGGNIQLNAVIDISAITTENSECNILENVENAYARKNDAEISLLSSNAEGNFEIAEEFDINGKLARVLYYDSKLVVKDANAKNGVVVVAGEIVAEICLELERGIETRFYTMVFSEEISAHGTEIGHEVYTEGFVKSNKLIISQENNNSKIKLENIVYMKALCFEKKYVAIVNDLYSPNYEMNSTSATMQAERLVFSKYYEEKINGLAALEEGMPSIQSIITTCVARNVMTNINCDDGFIVAEGLLHATVIYLDYDNNINSVKVELPYSLKKGVIEAKSTFNLLGNIIEGGVSSRIRRDKEIEVSAELKITADAFEKYDINYIAQLESFEISNNSLSPISIYIAQKGENFWDIGKALKASVDNIKMLNPNLSEPLTGNERIVIYRQRNMDNAIV